MFGSDLVEIAIGLIFVYLLLSLVCSGVNEMIEAVLKKRSSNLARGLRELLSDDKGDGLVKKVYEHPLIFGLFKGNYNRGNTKNLPEYIPARNFALALMDIVLPATSAAGGAPARPSGAAGATADKPESTKALRDAISNLADAKVKQALTTLVDAAGDDMRKARANIEAWFDSAMDRVSGWYKQNTQWILLGLGFLVTVGMNVNSIAIADRLSHDKALRNVIVAQAQEVAKQPIPSSQNSNQRVADLEKISLPIGWTNTPWNTSDCGVWNHFFSPLIGWCITAFAVSLGAPFWFDLLNKFMVIRSTVKPRETSADTPPGK